MGESMEIKYYYIVMSQKEMLQNQVLEEIVRERANYYISKKKLSVYVYVYKIWKRVCYIIRTLCL